jgi:hypothetical protein
MGIVVNVNNFARAETDRMFQAVLGDTGGINRWVHNRVPTPLDHQPVIRQNRDTLYSGSVIDISAGATLHLPDAGDRYLSAMVITEDHFVNAVYHDAGAYPLTVAEFETPFVMVAVRILVDPADPGDVAEVNALQGQLRVEANGSSPFASPGYDDSSFTATRQALLELAKGLDGFAHAFGRRDEVDPVPHLIGSAAAWGGLPDDEAYYLNVNPGLPVGEYRLTVRDVPVDGFWSVSVYNADGYFEPNDRDAVSVNNLTAVRDEDGAVTIHLGGDDTLANSIPITDGWNYLVRLYRPRPEVLDGTWTFPSITDA